MNTPTRTIVVFGSGPGIGMAVAAKFASHGFQHIILLSRNKERLENDKINVLAAANKNARVDTIGVDLSNQASLAKALQKIDELTTEVEVVLFNGARVEPSRLLEFPVEEIEADFRTTTIALYIVAQWAVPKLQALAKTESRSKPSLLVTSGLLHIKPEPDLFSLSLVKTAQRNLVQSLHAVYSPHGIHIGCILVGGIVSPDAKVLNPKNIGVETWRFFEDHRGQLEITLNEP